MNISSRLLYGNSVSQNTPPGQAAGAKVKLSGTHAGKPSAFTLTVISFTFITPYLSITMKLLKLLISVAVGNSYILYIFFVRSFYGQIG
jgi:hypothetical protein